MWRKRLSKLLGIIAVIALAALILIYQFYDPLTARIAKLESAGESVSLDDFAEKKIPKDQNADTPLTRAAPAIQRLLDVFLVGGETGNSLLFKSLLDLNDQDLAAIAKAFSKEPEVSSLLEKAAFAPNSYHDIHLASDSKQSRESDMLLYQQYRSAARLLILRANFLARTQTGDEGIESCIQLLRLARHVRKPTTGLAWLIGLAMQLSAIDAMNEILRESTASENSLGRLNEELSGDNDLAVFKEMLRTERAVALNQLQRDMYANRPLAPLWRKTIAEVLDVYADQIKRSDLTHVEAMRVTEPPVPWIRLTADDWNSSSFLSTRRAHDAFLAKKRCVLILIAIKRYQLSHPNAIPSIAELGLSPEVMADPFSEAHLLLRNTPRGPIIYSVYENLKDDGG